MSKAPDLEPGQIVHYTAEGYGFDETVTHAAIVLGSSHLEGRAYLDIRRGVYSRPGVDRPNLVEPYRLEEHEDGIPYSEEPKVGHWSLTPADLAHVRSFDGPRPVAIPSPGRLVTYTSRNGDGITSPALVLRTKRTTNLEIIERWGISSLGTLSHKGRPAELVPDLGDDYTVDLLVHGLGGDYREYAVPYASAPEPRTWAWPERV